MGVPASNIYLCADVPLNNRYDHTFYFATRAAQLAYFEGKVNRTLTAYTYLRKTWTLKIAATMEAARVWSYLFFQNGDGKRYFYFINQIEYVNDNTVELFLELDVIQTYMHDWEVHQCYVEREHSATDEIGENTIDEGLDVGELINAKRDICNLSDDIALMCAATDNVSKIISTGESDPVLAAYHDGIFSGFRVTATPLDDETWRVFGALINELNNKGKIDVINNLWEYPSQLLEYSSTGFQDTMREVVGSKKMEYHVSARPTHFGGYEPRNKKLFQYPFCFLYCTNNQGGAAVYHYERLESETDGRYKFTVNGNIGADATVRITPGVYKGIINNTDESLTMSGFPMCAWNSDSYKLWLAQNQNSQNLSYAMAGLKIVGGVAATVGGIATAGTGVGLAGASAGIGMVTSGATDIAGQLAQKADMEIQPPQSRGNTSGSHNLANRLQNFEFYHKTVDPMHARMIDNYFNMYGYACRQVKTPNYTNRPWWNYIKTVNSNITGNFAQEDVAKINAIFDKGITFWKTPSIGMYGLNNSPN